MDTGTEPQRGPECTDEYNHHWNLSSYPGCIVGIHLSLWGSQRRHHTLHSDSHRCYGQGNATANWDSERPEWGSPSHHSYPCSHCPHHRANLCGCSFHCHTGSEKEDRSWGDSHGAHQIQRCSLGAHHTPSSSGCRHHLLGIEIHLGGTSQEA